MSEKVNILLPIEILNRELDVRLFLACLCAEDSTRVFVGEVQALRRLSKSLHGGVYIGQSLLPTLPGLPTKVYSAFKKRGFVTIHLDEEGGVYDGDEERWCRRLRRRLDPQLFEAEDYVCTWGDFQRDFYRDQHPPCAEHIITTGHPRFDLYKEPYREYYHSEAEELRKEFGSFVLINTSWPAANDSMGVVGEFTRRRDYDVTDDAKRYDHVSRWTHLTQLLSSFVRMITRISIDLPELNYIVRPHPSENMDFYRTIFKGVKNVQVIHKGSTGAWLFACQALIQNGCTTGLEAHFADTPTITYEPILDQRYDLFLPNLFGARCTTEAEVVSCLQELAKTGKHFPPKAEKVALLPEAYAMNANFDGDALQILTRLILDLAKAQAADGTHAFHPRFYATAEMLRQNLQKVTDNLKRGAATSKSRPTMFYGLDRVNLDEKLAVIQKILNKKVEYSLLSNEILYVTS